jgi:hypothetical protein
LWKAAHLGHEGSSSATTVADASNGSAPRKGQSLRPSPMGCYESGVPFSPPPPPSPPRQPVTPTAERAPAAERKPRRLRTRLVRSFSMCYCGGCRIKKIFQDCSEFIPKSRPETPEGPYPSPFVRKPPHSHVSHLGFPKGRSLAGSSCSPCQPSIPAEKAQTSGTAAILAPTAQLIIPDDITSPICLTTTFPSAAGLSWQGQAPWRVRVSRDV